LLGERESGIEGKIFLTVDKILGPMLMLDRRKLGDLNCCMSGKLGILETLRNDEGTLTNDGLQMKDDTLMNS